MAGQGTERAAGRLVAAALSCYPPAWQRRHGEEAAELAALLIRDGSPAGAVAGSYLAGAARAWLTPPPGRLSALACALLAAAALLGTCAGLWSSAGPARAASTSTSTSTSARPAGTSPARWHSQHAPVPCLERAAGYPQPALPGGGHGPLC